MTVDAPSMRGTLVPGAELGGRYRIVCRVGAGGMGEVWRAFDLKLRVEVALKALREDLFQDERRRDLLRREVRAAREVVSPNVCRIFDLVEADGCELVSMEYVDGQTLLSVLQERGPLELKEAQDIASQFLAGLEAIHKVGLVHRDVKPENIMLTRAGRVVLMDFGLARHEEDPARSASGTPAYMAPEQAPGLPVDARADVYSAGVVLAEMVCPEGIKSIQSRQSVWEGVRSEPPKLPDTPWAPVLKKAVAKEPGQRYHSAHTLTRALEDVTLRVVGAEDLHPYPGLASFTEADAEYFFGREAEVEEMWRKLEGPTRLLGLAGPSGAGKSSFLRAGVIPAAGAGWGVVRCTPGDAAVSSLRRALIPELAGDTEALQQLVDSDDDDGITCAVARWRRRHEHGLLIVDQFEELFTQNDHEERARFGRVLGKLALEADAHVLLSLRDDFLAPCNGHEALRPIFHELTLLDPPAGANLRRALTQPALQCGYRFEDDALVEEMLHEVEGERGALPLLAFAAARLWEKRDRGTGLLTRQAYHDIGGVGGALARHAESTMDRIGSERAGIVRELFRNLVTAEGTRAVREWDELLSVFDGEASPMSSRARRPKAPPQPLSSRASEASRGIPRSQADDERTATSAPAGDPVRLVPLPRHSLRAGSSTPRPSEGRSAQDDSRSAADEVLRSLVDARLLTSYEVRQEEGEPTRRVEIIHESLLANWPRLVRWQTQDADAAQLRDQLRQAAKTWHEHGRTDDMLWTGAAFREFAVWRERYPGGLTELEEAFAAAMASLANRQRRRRRIAVTVVIAVLAVGLAVIGSFWRRAVQETRRAEAEAARREAGQLLALGRLRLADAPNRALAYAIASLDRLDNLPARRFSLEALWQGPPALYLESSMPAWSLAWSADGRRLALTGHGGLALVEEGSNEQRQLGSGYGQPFGLTFSADGRRLLNPIWGSNGIEWEVWSLPETRLERTVAPSGRVWPVDGGLVSLNFGEGTPGERPGTLRRLSVEGAVLEALGPWEVHGLSHEEVDPTGTWLVSLQAGRILEQRLDSLAAPPRLLGTHGGDVVLRAGPWRDRAVVSDAAGEVRIWDLPSARLVRQLKSPADATQVALDPVRRFVATGPAEWQTPRSVFLFDLLAPRPAEPTALLDSDMTYLEHLGFSPDGSWLASIHPVPSPTVVLWNMAGPQSMVLSRDRMPVVEFADERHLLSGGLDGVIRRWPLDPEADESGTKLWSRPGSHIGRLQPAPGGRSLAVYDAAQRNNVVALSLDAGDAGTPVLRRVPSQEDLLAGGTAWDPTGRFLAVQVWWPSRPDVNAIHVVDLATGAERALDTHPTEGERCWEAGSPNEGSAAPIWLRDGRLLSDGDGGVRVWDLDNATSQQLWPCMEGRLAWLATPDSQSLVCTHGPEASAALSVSVLDLASGVTRPVPTHGNRVACLALDPSGTILVTGDADGIVRVGPLTGEEPHLLLGHTGKVNSVAVSPDGRRIASGGADGTIRLWPMPDLSKPPLHTLPHDELLAKLKSLTNLRAVRNAASDSGWNIEVGPFPGWAEVPEWQP